MGLSATQKIDRQDHSFLFRILVTFIFTPPVIHRVLMLRIFVIALALSARTVFANAILIPMDESQHNHLKAYGVAFFILKKGMELDWLLNYRGGSFMVSWNKEIESECVVRGISFEVISDASVTSILKEISSPSLNMNVVKLEKRPVLPCILRRMS